MPVISSALTLPPWSTNLPTLALRRHLPREGGSELSPCELSPLFSFCYPFLYLFVLFFCTCQSILFVSVVYVVTLHVVMYMYMSKCVVVSMYVHVHVLFCVLFCVIVYVYVCCLSLCTCGVCVLCVCRGLCHVRSLLSSSPKMRRCYCTISFGRDTKPLVPRVWLTVLVKHLPQTGFEK